jgi:thiamine-monophosphate kinase
MAKTVPEEAAKPRHGAKAAAVSGAPAGELALIAALRARNQAAYRAIRLGIGDDCALIRPEKGEDLAVTTDFSLENVHFRRDWHPAESVGHRCLARGLSDLAAMGARPVAAFLSLALPAELAVSRRRQASWVERFFDGLLSLAHRAGVPLAGGDTAESPSGLVAADIVLLGGVKRNRALLRSGAKPGDLIYVTGTVGGTGRLGVTGALGGAAAELLALERNPRKFAALKAAAPEHPHLYPEPRLAVGQKLAAKGLATAAIDLSDGLSTDLRHLCEESGVSAEIDAHALPIHPMARLAEAAGWAPSALDLALHGGEDYELLFTASPQAKVPGQIGEVGIRAIGRMTPKIHDLPTITLIDNGRSPRELPRRGWEHLRGN